MNKNNLYVETRAVHSSSIDQTTGAIASPIHLSTTFERDEDGEYSRGFEYIRDSNPNRIALEECIAGLENGVEAVSFSSGMAAIMSILQCFKSGDHIILPDDMYFGARHLANSTFSRYGFEFSFVDMTKLDDISHNIHNNTKLIWIETPSNPLIKVVDIVAISNIAKMKNILCCCDNTWSTPIFSKPLDMGVDIVVHSSTKYFGGHCDAMNGVVVVRSESEFLENLKFIQKEGGAVPSPFDCWLVLRGIQTLPLRVKMQATSALNIAKHLEQNPNVEKVYYPGLKTHPNHLIATQQMSMYGGMLSFLVKGGIHEAMNVAGAVNIFIRATSLGGTHSLIEHRASVEGPDTTAPNNLLRISIGLENENDLMNDLDQALQSIV